MKITRRSLLKTIVVSATSAGLMGSLGCSDDGNTPLERVLTPVPDTEGSFPQSVMSGDPKANSVLFWTRVEDAVLGNASADLTLQISRSENFSNPLLSVRVVAEARFDHCVKVRVTDLDSDQTYYYRFIYERYGYATSSRTGRTRTAPAAGSARDIRYATLSCQDYIGRYFNTLHKLLESEQDNLDFIVHLGDYIYETVGDSSFQSSSATRNIVFDDLSGALAIGQDADNPDFYAARSLDNYRQLYRSYRSDELLKRVQERFPFICIWDDHEFSDDSWNVTATYLDGAKSEVQSTRKLNAQQAFFEYMPVDHESADLDTDELSTGKVSIDSARGSRIYRAFQFGSRLQLFTTDYRSYRTDHLIRESAWPGQILMTEDDLTAWFTASGQNFADVRERYSAYVDVDESADLGAYRDYLSAAIEKLYTSALENSLARFADQDELHQRAVELRRLALGNTQRYVTVEDWNSLVPDMLEAMNEDPDRDPGLADVSEIIADGTTPRGLAYRSMGKVSPLSDIGSRYFVVKDTFDVFAGWQYSADFQNDPDRQTVYGTEQQTWLTEHFEAATASWKVLASSVSFTPIVVDLSQSSPLDAALDLANIPDRFRWHFYLNVDHWDGFPDAKANLQNTLLNNGRVVSIAGDIHASLLSSYTKDTTQWFDITGPSVSSEALGGFVQARAGDISPQLPLLLPFLEDLITSSAPSGSEIAYNNLYEHGMVIITVRENELDVRYHTLPESAMVGGEQVDLIAENHYDRPDLILGQFRETAFTVSNSGINPA